MTYLITGWMGFNIAIVVLAWIATSDAAAKTDTERQQDTRAARNQR